MESLYNDVFRPKGRENASAVVNFDILWLFKMMYSLFALGKWNVS